MGGTGSGRKRKSVEHIKDETDKIKYRAIHKSWQLYDEFINDETLDRNYKVQFAIDIVKRSVPQEIKGDIKGGDTKVIIIERERAVEAKDNRQNISVRLPQQ